MVLSDTQQREYVRRLLLSRMRILLNNGFYGLLLMSMAFAIDEDCETASTNGKKIFFGPQFLDELSDSELDFIMMHEVMHVVLQHCLRGKKKNDMLFNIACDIVVNSNIKKSCGGKDSAITLRNYGTSMHLAPDGKEGYNYTAEEVYNMFIKKYGKYPTDADKGWDDHDHWGEYEDDETFSDELVKRFEDACEAVSIQDPSNQRGTLPTCAERMLKELRNHQIDWRIILNDFVQEEVVDYSFVPPDRRFNDSQFFLPDFNEMEDLIEDILFMIDTSGSMSDEMITAAYSEVKGAIDQFGGALKGWLGFFDGSIVEPRPFENEDEFKIIKPAGGGGTSFAIIFEYVRRYMEKQGKTPASIVILTDGFAPYPEEKVAMGIPVLWLLNNEQITPPWGRVARIKV